MILVDHVHLVSDESTAELHAFAARIGVRRGWYRRGHYDLRDRKRVRALLAGAVEVSTREIVRRMVGRRRRCNG